jgi:hypothetical protein
MQTLLRSGFESSQPTYTICFPPKAQAPAPRFSVGSWLDPYTGKTLTDSKQKVVITPSGLTERPTLKP